jgi:hypothetical protein
LATRYDVIGLTFSLYDEGASSCADEIIFGGGMGYGDFP